MLGIMRKNAGSWVVKLILGGIALVFALSFGTSSFFSESGTALKVNGEEITELQVYQEIENLYDTYTRQFGPEFARQLPGDKMREMAKSNLLQQTLLRQAARQLGIITPPEEVKPYIEADPLFQQNGTFNFEQYQVRLRSMNLSPEQFEARMQNQLTLEKLLTMLRSSVLVTDDELTQFTANMFTRIEGAYLLFQAKDHIKQVKLQDEEVAAYYQEHKNEYMEPARLRFAYLKFTNQHFLSSVEVGDEQLSQAYESNIERFVKPEVMMVRSIALEVPPRADEGLRQQIKQKAEAIMREGQAAGNDFVALAKTHDQSPTGRNGELWPVKREDLAPEAAQQLFSTPSGQLALVETPASFMIIKAESHQPVQVTPLGEVKEQLRGEIQARSAGVAANRAASQALADMHRGRTLEQVAGQHGIKVEETALLAIDEDLDGMPPTREVWDTLLGLKPGQAGVPLNFGEGVLLPVLIEQVEAEQKPLPQVKEQVEKALTNQKAAEMALSAAQAKITELKAAANPAEAMLGEKGVIRFGPILANEEINELSGSDTLKEALFNQVLNAPVADVPLPVLDGQAVGVLLRRITPGSEEMEELKESQRASLLERKLDAAFETYLQDLMTRAEIEEGR